MVLLIFAVRDSKAEMFTQPMFFQAPGQAVRAISDAVNDPKNDFGRHPDDYTLFHIGSYDDQSGRISPLDAGMVNFGLLSTFVSARDPRQLSLEA